MTFFDRRQALTLIGSGLIANAWAQPTGRRPLAEGPRVCADPDVIQSGLANKWQSAMKRDLGWSAPFQAESSGTVLDLLEQGQTDVGFFYSQAKADQLDKQGLIYERQTLATTGVVLIGPNQDLAGIRAETDIARALTQIIVAAGAGQAVWQAPEAGSALQAWVQGLTQGLSAQKLAGTTGKTASGPAYQLATQAGLGRKGLPKGTRVWAINDPRMVLQLQSALSFRSRHQAGKLLTGWLKWPLAQGIVSKAQPAWRTPTAR